MQEPLHPRLKRLLFFINLIDLDTTKPMNKTRSTTNRFMKFMNWYGGYKYPDFYSVRDVSFQSPEGHTIKLKVFNPEKTDKKLPVWLYIHGGGFCHGEYDSRTNFCKAIATRANCVVVSVDYRLAPEHPFPAAPNDVYAAVKWLWQNAEQIGGNKNKIAVGGESAGGNLSTVVSLMARDNGGPTILHQTLLYPAVDMYLDKYASMDAHAKGYMLEKKLIEAFHNSYAPAGVDWNYPYLSPILADLQGLPPALVITAGYDPLVDEGDMYAAKLQQAGVPVVHKRYDNMIHDFTMLLTSKLDEAKDSVDIVVREVKRAFA
ncbi:MAG TPA: alpha/beta hydrolase [Chitinophagales bacterium]|nr:alpha/beta hydrolase [Chitinophagales bacterium]